MWEENVRPHERLDEAPCQSLAYDSPHPYEDRKMLQFHLAVHHGE